MQNLAKHCLLIAINLNNRVFLFFQQANPGRYKFDVFLARKLANGEISTPRGDPDKKRLERVYSPSNMDKIGLPGDIIIREPLMTDGISRISIKLTDTQHDPAESDIPIYVSCFLCLQVCV